MKPFPFDVLDDAFGISREPATMVPCCAPGCGPEEPDALCTLCSGAGLISIEARAAWIESQQKEEVP